MAYDAVVIGAGVNGLAAAVHLCARGWKVAVVERADVAGGAVKTREITRPGFRHDLYAMNLGLFAGSPFFATHKDQLLANGLGFVSAEHCFASAFPDGTWVGVEKNPEANAQRIAALSTADAERWRALTAAFAQDAPHIFGLLGAPMPSWQAARTIFAAWRARGTGWVAETARLLASSPREWLDENFENEKLKATLAIWGMHLDFSPDVAGGALFPYLEAMADQVFGMALGQGGADTIINAMTRTIEAAGGTVKLSAPVQSVAIEGNAAKAVVLANGERIEATRAVIANLHPRVLFDELVRGAPPAARRLAKLRPGPATMMVHFALSALPAWSAGAELRKFAYVHLAPSLGLMAKTYTDALDGLAADRARACRRPANGRSIPRARRPDSMCSGCRFGFCRRASAATPAARLPPPIGTRRRKPTRTASSASSSATRPVSRRPFWAAPCFRPPISSATIPIWSAATASAAATTSIRTSSSALASAGRATARRSNASTWSAPRPGRAPAPAPAPASCWRKCWRGRERR